MSNLNSFINTYKISHHLASKAELAFNMLINSLNKYFDCIENITDRDVKETLIKWYTNAFIGGTDTIWAKSNYYNIPTFSNVAINMDEEKVENYNTFYGICFAKVN